MFISLLAISIQIGPFHGSHRDKTRVKVRVQLNLHGIVSVESATVSKKPLFFHLCPFCAIIIAVVICISSIMVSVD